PLAGGRGSGRGRRAAGVEGTRAVRPARRDAEWTGGASWVDDDGRHRGSPAEAAVAEQVNQAIAADGHQPGESLGDLVRDATEQMSTLFRAELELAKLELAATAKRAGMGGALFGAAAAVVGAALPFLFVSLAQGLVQIFNGWRGAPDLLVFVPFLLVPALPALLACP